MALCHVCVVCDYHVKCNVCIRDFKMEEDSGEIDDPDTIEGANNDSNVVFGEYSDAVNLHSHSLAFEKSFQLRVLWPR